MYVYNYLWLMYRVKYIIFSLTRTKAALVSVTARAYFLQKLLQYLNRISPPLSKIPILTFEIA